MFKADLKIGQVFLSNIVMREISKSIKSGDPFSVKILKESLLLMCVVGSFRRI